MSINWINKYLEKLEKVDIKHHKVSEKIKFSSLAKISPLNLGELYFHQYIDIYPKYLELNKIERSMVRQKIADASSLFVSTIDKRFSMLNTARNRGIDISLISSFNQVYKEIKNSKNSSDSAINNGEKKNIDKSEIGKYSKLQTKKVVIHTTDENEIISILSSPSFKMMRKEFDANGWKLANVLKALKT